MDYQIPFLTNFTENNVNLLWIDTRNLTDFIQQKNQKHFHLPLSSKWLNWFEKLIKPEEDFYLIVENEKIGRSLIEDLRTINYQTQCKALITGSCLEDKNQEDVVRNLDLSIFSKNLEKFTILDVRNPEEVEQRKIFSSSLNIPLIALRDKIKEIPQDKPIVVHCAVGYRSAIATSILKSELKNIEIFDLGEYIGIF